MPSTRSNKLSLRRAHKEKKSPSLSLSGSPSLRKLPSLPVAMSTPRTHSAPQSTHHQLHDELKNLLQTDTDLVKSIGEAVARILADKLLASPTLMDAITQEICKNDNLIESVAIKMSEDVKQHIYQSTSHDIDAIKTQLETTEKSNKKLRKQLDQQDDKIDDLEQYSRRNCLLLHGISESNNETTDDIAINTIVEKLKVPIKSDDIDRTHRLGKKKQPHDSATGDELRDRRPRPIIIKFCSYAKRSQVFLAKRALKGTNMLITESLTVKRMNLLKDAIASTSVQSAWSQDGKITCLLKNDRIAKIHNSKDLEKL